MEGTLTCAVCLSLFEEPVTLPVCSHNFCRACVAACLSQARRPAEQPLRQPPQSHERPRPPEAEQGSAAPASDSNSLSVPCPLCRKPCALPGRHGVAALPVNTTLAEVVKLFKAGRGGAKAGGGEARAAVPASAPRLAGQDVPCEKHPGKPLQLFCRMCCRPACGQCVSEEHQGVFHSVNLISAAYQEQKLNFFSYLKEIRKINEQLVKEVAAFRNDMETQKQKEEKMIKRQFEYISKTLEMKKQQLLDSLEGQKEKREKEYEIWKKMKDGYRKTIENYLSECEKIINECDPQRFLEVACNLNLRMKNQIDMIQISSRYENLPGYKQMHMDTTSVVHSIFALHLTPINLSVFKDIPSRDRECVVFGNTDKKSEVQKKIQNVFKPVAGVDVLPDGRMIQTQIMSISEAPEFGQMSHEEVRYNYYMAHQVDNLEKHTYTSPLNGRCIFPESPCSTNQPPEAPLFSFSAKASDLKLKPQKQDVNETSFSKSLGYLFSTPAVNLNFSGSNNNFNLFNVKGSQKDSPKTDSLLTTAQIPETNAGALSFEVQTSLTVSSDLLPVAVPSVAVLNQHSSSVVTEQTAPTVFSCSSGKASTPSLKYRNSVFSTVLLEKPESQNNGNDIHGYNCPAPTEVSVSTTTSPKSDSTDSGKPLFSAFSTTPGCGLSLPNKQQSSFSLSSPVQNKNEENQICCQHRENNLGNSSGKKLKGNCNSADSLPYKSSCCVLGKAGASEKQSAPGEVSANYFWETNTTPIFSFPGGVKNNQDAQTTSMTSDNKTKSPSDKSKIESNDLKRSAVKNTSPSSSSKDLRSLMHSFSSFFMEKLKSETESIVVSQKDAANDSAANKTSVSGNLTELNSQSENPPRNENTKEDHVGSHSLRNGANMINAESDGEHLSQASNSNDSIEEKILSR
ncbi:PREDICTED: uncharacterized protein LOC107114675 isoform X2 [Gekko japonicus]|uniref:Uncharacterized protein LOC107114675 isoform X2 n=1 Tax=Gekko japonicus TaxID=146911 RepID=A0ABM1KDE5_GEKJA|nr:PREDICTED: uncharacterized protein LOC107114675 isoform X2 [Gekko japonicus]